MSRLPSLNALRVFEAAARHQNLTKAGEELGVTQSAVSKQVAQLEAVLQQPLFERRHRRIELTPFGREVAAAVSGTMTQLAQRLDAIATDRPHQITFVAELDFIQLWLLQRLFRFEAAHPSVRISLTGYVAEGGEALPEGDWQCAVVWGRGAWSGCRFEQLFTNQIFPVAAPAYLDRIGWPARVSDLAEDALIHDRSTFWWSAFRAAEGLTNFDPEAGRIYNQTSLCLEAAAQGIGATVGDEVTTRPYLEDGRLVCPFEARLHSPEAYYLVVPANLATTDTLALFLDWLKREAQAHRTWYADFWDCHPAARQAARRRPL